MKYTWVSLAVALSAPVIEARLFVRQGPAVSPTLAPPQPSPPAVSPTVVPSPAPPVVSPTVAPPSPVVSPTVVPSPPPPSIIPPSPSPSNRIPTSPPHSPLPSAQPSPSPSPSSSSYILPIDNNTSNPSASSTPILVIIIASCVGAVVFLGLVGLWAYRIWNPQKAEKMHHNRRRMPGGGNAAFEYPPDVYGNMEYHPPNHVNQQQHNPNMYAKQPALPQQQQPLDAVAPGPAPQNSSYYAYFYGNNQYYQQETQQPHPVNPQQEAHSQQPSGASEYNHPFGVQGRSSQTNTKFLRE